MDSVTPLHLAATGGYLSIVKYLTLDQKCSPLCKDKNGNSPLHRAATRGQLEVVQFLTSDNFHHDPVISNRENKSAQLSAVKNGHLSIVQYFIEEKMCSPAELHSSGLTLLHTAAMRGHLSVVKYLTNIQDYRSYGLINDESTPL